MSKYAGENGEGKKGRVNPFLGFTLRDVRKWGTHPPSTSSFPRHRCGFSDRGRRGSTWTWDKVCSLSRGSISLVVAPSRQTGSRKYACQDRAGEWTSSRVSRQLKYCTYCHGNNHFILPPSFEGIDTNLHSFLPSYLRKLLLNLAKIYLHHIIISYFLISYPYLHI